MVEKLEFQLQFVASSKSRSVLYELPYEKLLDLYKNNKLDGTQTTYICQGEIINNVKEGEPYPRYTIRDGPPYQMYASRQCGALDMAGFYHVGQPSFCVDK